MTVCPNCGHQNQGQPTQCENCDAALEPDPLAHLSPDATLVMGESMAKFRPTRQKVWRSAELGDGREFELLVNGVAVAIALSPEEALTLGRGSDDTLGDAPYLNLSEYQATKGVSRQHAAISLNNGMLVIRDLGSTNGTFVNGQRVSGEDWRVVRDQDELSLGSLTIKLHLNGAA